MELQLQEYESIIPFDASETLQNLFRKSIEIDDTLETIVDCKVEILSENGDITNHYLATRVYFDLVLSLLDDSGVCENQYKKIQALEQEYVDLFNSSPEFRKAEQKDIYGYLGNAYNKMSKLEKVRIMLMDFSCQTD